MLTPEDIARYDNIFEKLKDQPTSLSGGCAKEKWAAFSLQPETMMKVWALADVMRRLVRRLRGGHVRKQRAVALCLNPSVIARSGHHSAPFFGNLPRRLLPGPVHGPLVVRV